MPLRWRQALNNLEAAQGTLSDLSKQLEGALHLDDEAWQLAVPHAQFTAALQVGAVSPVRMLCGWPAAALDANFSVHAMQGQQRKIQELEQQLRVVVARLEESERGRRAAEERARQLSAELENNASVFKLHYEELLRREQEVHDLQAVISALSLGGGDDSSSIRGAAGSGGPFCGAGSGSEPSDSGTT